MNQKSRKWTTLVDSETRANALNIATQVASRLKDRDVLKRAAHASVEQSDLPDLMRWRQYSLHQGSAGLAILFEQLERSFPGHGWDEHARWHLETAARSLETYGSHLGIPLFGELSGVAYAAWFLSHGGQRYRGLLSDLDQILLPLIEKHVETLNEMEGGTVNHLYDVITGISGAGIYLLERRDFDAPRKTMDAVLKCLVDLCVEEEGGPRWRTPPGRMYDEKMASQFPGGFYNCGLAHGIPGPLAAMSIASLAGVQIPGMDAAIRGIASWLTDHRSDDEFGINWPVAFPMTDTPLAKQSTPPPCRAGWCYGSPGVSRALFLAGKAAGNTELCDFAVRAMRDVIGRPAEARQLTSPMLCHGGAGLLQIALRFANDSSDPVLENAIESITQDLLAHYEPDSILGYRSLEFTGRKIDNPGLLDGAPGACLALLASAVDVEPAWDRLFLLS